MALNAYNIRKWYKMLTGQSIMHVNQNLGQCVEWTVGHQESAGAWNNFFFRCPDHPYGAMAQGEAASLLVRAFCEFHDEKYLDAAHRAISFMLKPIDEGGTTSYADGKVVLLEFTHLAPVMNGWIFAWFGLYDYCLVANEQKAESVKQRSLESLITMLPRFRNSFWSLYSLDGKIASPFYQNLHIAQMEALFQLTGEDIFHAYAHMWRKQQGQLFNYSRAFIKKAWQKIKE